ncbi:hypothetical protein QFC21_006626 [Naganishia friedmannii]|uniref:Uncharacterized protein n=1 Tax=Naganishia friedmannii TaxID=89922 RepID=A0ACC2V144_9TREE|nr:hypothetical protein QFC21_006626 [Naganishia friedmannii]
MSATLTETITPALETLRLRPTPSVAQEPAPSTTTLKGETEKTDDESDYPYARFLPHFDTSVTYPPLTDFEHHDPGLEALKHAEPRAFLNNATVANLTPRFGAEVSGIQLHKLTPTERQQLALFVAQRGVVAFRDQDFQDQSPEWMLQDWGSFFGRLHIHPTSGHPKGYPEFHLVYRDAGKTLNYEFSDRFTSSVWHSDVTYERQPPGLTTLWLFDSPSSGGDTAYVNQVEAYNRLSPSFRAYLETLQVVHSGVEQAEYSRRGNRGGTVRREPVETVHPLVRTHPVTGAKALYVNKQFARRIVGLKQEESEAILNLLYNHIALGVDFQTRIKWAPRTVVLWDNRITAHSAIVDFDSAQDGRRHGGRITPQAERPFLRLMPFNAPLKKSTPVSSRRPSSPSTLGPLPAAPPQPQPHRNISDFSNASTCSTSTSASETSSLEAAPMRPPLGQGAGGAEAGAGGAGYGHRYGYGYQDVRGSVSRAFLPDEQTGSQVSRPASTPAASNDSSSHPPTTDDYSTASNTFVQQRLSGYNLASPTAQSFGNAAHPHSQPMSRGSSSSRSPVTPRAARHPYSSTLPAPPATTAGALNAAAAAAAAAGQTGTSAHPHTYTHTHVQPYLHTYAASGINIALAASAASTDPETKHLLARSGAGSGVGELRASSSGPDLAELRRRAAEGRYQSAAAPAGVAGSLGFEQGVNKRQQQEEEEEEEEEEDIVQREATPRVTDLGIQRQRQKRDDVDHGEDGEAPILSDKAIATTRGKQIAGSREADALRQEDSTAAPAVDTSGPSRNLRINSPPRPDNRALSPYPHSSSNANVGVTRDMPPPSLGAGAMAGGATRLEARKAVGLQDFLFGEVIGRGSYSTVILATQKATSIPYAIKILDQFQLVQEKKTKYAKIERDALVRLGPMAVHPTTASRATHHGMGCHPNGVASARASRRGSEQDDPALSSSSRNAGPQVIRGGGGLSGAVNSQLARLTNGTRIGQSSSMPGWKRTQPPAPALAPPPPAHSSPPPPADGSAVMGASTRKRSASGATVTPDDNVATLPTNARTTGNPSLMIQIPETGSSYHVSQASAVEGTRGSAGNRLTVPVPRSPLIDSREDGVEVRERENKMSSSQATIVPPVHHHGPASPISRVRSASAAPPTNGARSGHMTYDDHHSSGGSGSGVPRKQKKRPRSAHPGVVRLHYTFKDDTSLYFVLDLAINGEILSFIKKHGSFDVESAKRYAAQLIDTVEFMHERGVIHRDLKPENILLDEDMRIKVTDFGSAKVLDLSELPINKPLQNGKAGAETDAVADGQEDQRKRSFVGTAEYVSPEVLRNEHASFAADIWAFGCILFQMLAGRPPFRGATEYLTFQQVLKAEYEFPEGFDEQAKALIQQVLKLDPAERLDVEKIKAHPFFDDVDFARIWTDYMPDIHTGIQPPAQTTTMQFAWDDLIGGKADSSESGMQSASNKSSRDSGSHEIAHLNDDDEDLEAPRRRWVEHGGAVGTFSSGSGTTDDGVTLVGGSGLVRRVNTTDGERQPAKDVTDKSMLPHRRISLQGTADNKRNKWSDHLVQGEEIVYQSAILLRSGLLLPKRRTLVLTSLPRLICVKEGRTSGKIKIEAECLFERPGSSADGNGGDRQEENNQDTSRKRMVKKVFPKPPRAFVVKTGEKERVFIADREEIRARWMEELDKVKPKENKQQ